MFNREALHIKSLAERKHDLNLDMFLPMLPTQDSLIPTQITKVAKRIFQARKKGSSVIFMMGAHVIRSGTQSFLIDLMERGYFTGLAMNGSGIIHDYEIARIGATTESVARYIKTGEFGLWKETGFLNDIINSAYKKDANLGLGRVIGEAIEMEDLPHKNLSLFSAGYRLKIPITVHVGIGHDIIHEHPNCDGAATGALTYNDFLIFASEVNNLENGVVMNFGSSVMAPEVFLKALSMARNLAHQKGKEIKRFTTLVCDLHELPNNFSQEPKKGTPEYYFRPWKTMLTRTVADGGESFYVKGRHHKTIPALWTAINQIEKENNSKSK